MDTRENITQIIMIHLINKFLTTLLEDKVCVYS